MSVARSLVDRSQGLCAELAAVMMQSRVLLAAGRERRLTTTYSRLRPIRGGAAGDSALITTIIASVSLCAECIEKHTGIPGALVASTIARISETFRVARSERCQSCLQVKPAFTLGPDGGPPRPQS